jgi:hypothetical protein
MAKSLGSFVGKRPSMWKAAFPWPGIACCPKASEIAGGGFWVLFRPWHIRQGPAAGAIGAIGSAHNFKTDALLYGRWFVRPDTSLLKESSCAFHTVLARRPTHLAVLTTRVGRVDALTPGDLRTQRHGLAASRSSASRVTLSSNGISTSHGLFKLEIVVIVDSRMLDLFVFFTL